MFSVLLLYCIQIVSFVFSFALRDGNMPYFPIEISRAAADGGVQAAFIFKLCFFVGPPILSILHMAPGASLYTFAAYVGLQFITFFDDVLHWRMHMFGVLLMGLGAAAHIVFTFENNFQVILLVTASLIWLLRLCLKFLVLVFVERESSTNAAEKGMYIMHTGRCKEPHITLNVFRACGVLQWLVFGLILCAL